MGMFSELFKKIGKVKKKRVSSSVREVPKQNSRETNYRYEGKTAKTVEQQSVSEAILKEAVETQNIKTDVDESNGDYVLKSNDVSENDIKIEQENDISDIPEEKLPLFQRYHVDVDLFGDTPITTLSISQRLANILLRNGYQTIKAFLELSEEDISKIKHSGKVTVSEAIRLAQMLAEGGVEIHTEDTEKTDEDSEMRYCDRYSVDSEAYDHLSLPESEKPSYENRTLDNRTLENPTYDNETQIKKEREKKEKENIDCINHRIISYQPENDTSEVSKTLPVADSIRSDRQSYEDTLKRNIEYRSDDGGTVNDCKQRHPVRAAEKVRS